MTEQTDHLIAAAPDLLEALRHTLDVLEEDEELGLSDQQLDLLEALRHALAKAMGVEK